MKRTALQKVLFRARKLLQARLSGSGTSRARRDTPQLRPTVHINAVPELAHRRQLTKVVLALALLAACDSLTDGGNVERYTFDFGVGAPGWEGGFAQVEVAAEDRVAFVGDHRALPQPLGPARKALYQSGFNASDDLLMYFTYRLQGLRPNATYNAAFEVRIVSNEHQGCNAGVGSLVSVKVGATPVKPQRAVVDGYYVLNVDTGDGAMADGAAALRLGDIRNGLPACPGDSPAQYAEKTLTSGARTLSLTSAPDGSVWLLIATDSAFESQHHVYFTALTVSLRPTI